MKRETKQIVFKQKKPANKPQGCRSSTSSSKKISLLNLVENSEDTKTEASLILVVPKITTSV